MTRRHSGRVRRRAISSVWALSLVSIWLAGQFAVFAHQLLVQHQICPEHGKLIHVSEGPQEADAFTHGAARSVSRSPIARDSSHRATAGQEHVHCTVTTHRRHEATIADAAGVAVPCGADVQRMDANHSTRPVGVAVHRFAPKNSPPA